MNDTLSKEQLVEELSRLRQRVAELEAAGNEHKQAEEQLQRYTLQLEALHDVSLELSGQLDLEPLLQAVVTRAVRLLQGVSGGLYLYRPERDAIEYVLESGNPAMAGTWLSCGEGVGGHVWATGQTVVVEDYQHWERRAAAFAGGTYGSVVGAPIRWGGDFLGVLVVDHTTLGAFNPADASLLETFANQVAGAIHNARLYRDLQQQAEALRESETKFRQLVENIQQVFWIRDLQTGHLIYLSPSYESIWGHTVESAYRNPGTFLQAVHPDDVTAVAEVYRASVDQPVCTEYRIVLPNATTRWVEVRTFVVREEGGQRQQVGLATDVTQRRRMEEEIRRNEARLKGLVNILQHGPQAIQDFLDFALNEAIKLTRSQIGYIYHYDEDSQRFVLNTWSRDVMQTCRIAEPQTVYALQKTGIWGEAVRQRKPIVVNDFAAPHPLKRGYPEGHAVLHKFLTIPVFHEDRIVAVIGVANKPTDYDEVDVLQLTLLMDAVWKATARKQAEEALACQAQELARSNADLQHFVYAISHDLQEPLRMISSYVELLQKRYVGRLDPDADEFIDYAVEGAQRMSAMIHGILDYSRVNTLGQELALTDCQALLEQVLRTCQLTIKDSGATVSHDPLPAVTADETQLMRVFQNLLSNALKFRAEQPPQVHISARRCGREWEFSVQDNGIGIDPQYTGQLFQVFRRLHSRAEYPGAGIGLALCRRIVERHGGRMWVESQPGQGSTFYFTIPDP